MPINSWAQFKTAVRNLKNKEVREKFSVVVIDTLDLLQLYCSKAIGMNMSTERNSYDFAEDVDFGRGGKRVGQEIKLQLKELEGAGYSLILIAHAAEKENFITKQTQIKPTIDANVYQAVCDFADFSIYIDPKGATSTAYFRHPKLDNVGCRFKDIENPIEFSYENLCKAIKDAAEKQSDNLIDRRERAVSDDTIYFVEKEQQKFKEATERAIEKGILPSQITLIVESYLGDGKKIANAQPRQAELVHAALKELEELIN